MAIDIETIKKLRAVTGVGITDAKKALEEADGDYDKAVEAMRVKGLARADKKADREASAGIIDSYVHGERIGVLVEVNCETDFVARTDDFKDLVHNIALHIAAASPQYLNSESVDKDAAEKERKLFAQELKNEGKPAEMIEKIVEGKIKKWYSEVCLMDQAYVKNPDQTITDLVKESVAKLGENIVVKQFSRIEMGS
jgi:elongation factor Ts